MNALQAETLSLALTENSEARVPIGRFRAPQTQTPHSLIFLSFFFNSLLLSWEFAKGGQNVSCDFGGENVPYSTPSKTSFGGLIKLDLSGLCRFPLRRMTLREQRGGGKSYHKWGGSKTVFGGGDLWYVFPSPEFPPPLVFL